WCGRGVPWRTRWYQWRESSTSPTPPCPLKPPSSSPTTCLPRTDLTREGWSLRAFRVVRCTVVWAWCSLENQMVSVERILHFSHPAVPSKAPLVLPHHRPPPNWPHKVCVELDGLQVQYRPDLPMVLKGVTLTIPGGNKVGIVGRTGSGKSTLVAALFRLVEPAGGRVVIDDVDIGSIGLGDLRGRLAIIPQDPTLFQG
ncbi:unnamed protein product, partial [Closterium sp. NIES-54]